jgi:hypothetical protein
MRQQIRPGLYQLWRAPGRLQVGLDGIVLDGLTAMDERLMAMLDGSRGVEALQRHARSRGYPLSRLRDLLATLDGAGALLPRRTTRARLGLLDEDTRGRLRPDAETLSVAYPTGDGWDVLVDRAERSAAVVGLGRTGLALAGHLARAGIGTVVLDDDGPVRDGDVAPGGYRLEDVGRRRAQVADRWLGAASPQTRTRVDGDLRPDLLVLVGHGAIDTRRTDGLLREDVPHLAVLLREQDAVVGPLVVPGRTACLRCLDLHRSDRDPEWPRLVPQLASRANSRREETVLAALAAALAAAQALAHLDGRVRPTALDATLELALPDPLVAVRPWSAHPACGCTWPPAGATSRAHAPSRSIAPTRSIKAGVRTPPSAGAAAADTMGA